MCRFAEWASVSQGKEQEAAGRKGIRSRESSIVNREPEGPKLFHHRDHRRSTRSEAAGWDTEKSKIYFLYKGRTEGEIPLPFGHRDDRQERAGCRGPGRAGRFCVLVLFRYTTRYNLHVSITFIGRCAFWRGYRRPCCYKGFP